MAVECTMSTTLEKISNRLFASKKDQSSSKRFNVGVCVGKFYPPHKGHEYLVRTGISQCHRLVVVVCVKPKEIPNLERAQWLQSNCPDAKVHVFNEVEELDPDDSSIWAELAKSFLDGQTPDACFSSEAYGASFARALGPNVVDVRVDEPRNTVPISGTQVRSDPLRSWEYISPNVRQFYCRLVVLAGAESTGKSTLCKELAKAFGNYRSAFVEEHGRVVTDRKTSPRDNWTVQDFKEICDVQTTAIENAVEEYYLVFADTDARATLVWQRHLMGHITPDIEELSKRARVPALYIFCPVQGSSFVQDGTRKDGDHRVEMEAEIRTRCIDAGANIVELSGNDWKTRTDEAVKAVRDLLEQ